MDADESWPPLPYEEWAATKKTLHLCTQLLGKTRLALAQPQPEWLHASLQLDGRGFTTGAMTADATLLHAGFDVMTSALWLRRSDGRERSVPVTNGRCVADVWDDYLGALRALEVEADLWDKPQEVADTTPLSENTHDCTLSPDQAQRFHRALTAVYGVLDEFRSSFFGRTGVQFWWGSFDLSVLLFSGRRLVPPDDRGYLARYDRDAEHLSAGFWPGDDSSPEPIFYGYLLPQPSGCETAPVEPVQAGWVEAMSEWVLPYEAVRSSNDPRRTALAFLTAVYKAAVTIGGWAAEDFTYEAPSASRRGHDGSGRSETGAP